MTDPSFQDSSNFHNLGLEYNLLSTLLWSNNAYYEVCDILSPHHFFYRDTQDIYREIEKRISAGEQVTSALMIDFFKNHKNFQKKEKEDFGLQILQDIESYGMRTFKGVYDYAQQIKKHYQRRVLRQNLEERTADCDHPVSSLSVEEIIQSLDSKNLELLTEGQNNESMSLSQALTESLKKAEMAYKGDQSLFLKTGIKSVDEIIVGLFPQKIFVVAGRPAMGKTSFVTKIALNVAKQNKVIAFFQLEMTPEEMASRIMANAVNLTYHDYVRGNFNQVKSDEINRVKPELAKLNIEIITRHNMTVERMRVECKKLKNRHGSLDLVILDNIGLMEVEDQRHNANIYSRVTQVSRKLKMFATEMNVPLIVLSQLNRESEKRSDNRPNLSDLRDSGAIEQDADIVGFLYREEYFLKRNMPDLSDIGAFEEWKKKMWEAEGKSELIIAKSRNGNTGTALLNFEGKQMEFLNRRYGE